MRGCLYSINVACFNLVKRERSCQTWLQCYGIRLVRYIIIIIIIFIIIFIRYNGCSSSRNSSNISSNQPSNFNCKINNNYYITVHNNYYITVHNNDNIVSP